jgi:hypothetical protein
VQQNAKTVIPIGSHFWSILNRFSSYFIVVLPMVFFCLFFVVFEGKSFEICWFDLAFSLLFAMKSACSHCCSKRVHHFLRVVSRVCIITCASRYREATTTSFTNATSSTPSACCPGAVALGRFRLRYLPNKYLISYRCALVCLQPKLQQLVHDWRCVL